MSAFVTSVLDTSNYFLEVVSPMPVSLPQSAGSFDRVRRQWDLTEGRATFRFNYTHVPTLAIADSVPLLNEFNLPWIFAVLEKALIVLENRAQLSIGSNLAQIHKDKLNRFRKLQEQGPAALPEMRSIVHDAMTFDKRVGAATNQVQTLKEYSDLFRSIGLPPISTDFQKDELFADMRVAGPNPVMLQRMTKSDERLPITDALFKVAAPNDSLDVAMSEARLYVADYAMLDGTPTGSFPHGQKYLAAPIALFVVDKLTRRLMPVAIQCHQKPGPDNPIFTPNDGWNWMIAKTFVEVADGNVHEAVTHLARTHLSMEPFALSTLRQLAPAHPLSRLLRPHFAGTMNINELAWQHLIADGGGVDQLMSASIQAARGLAVKGVQTLDVMNSRLPKTFAARGVDDASALPHYPYRDDSTLYWNTIHNWVESYVKLYYSSDAIVGQDWELQAWILEIGANDGGRISGLPGTSLNSIADLIEVLTFVIYTCSVQHAAVNFPQYDYMAYAPNMPLASYRPPLTSTSGATEADFLAMLPPLDMAELQMELGFLLGTVHFTQLGQYDANQFGRDGRVSTAQKKFQDDLVTVGTTIAESNLQRPRPYKILEPVGIPQSINI